MSDCYSSLTNFVKGGCSRQLGNLYNKPQIMETSQLTITKGRVVDSGLRVVDSGLRVVGSSVGAGSVAGRRGRGRLGEGAANMCIT